jgi:methanogenic corrinoid protein MtbC1
MSSSNLGLAIKTGAGRRPKRRVPGESPSASAVSRHRHYAFLARAIEARIIPQLALAHRYDDVRPHQAVGTPEAVTADLQSFTALMLANDLQGGLDRVEQRVSGGAGLADVCLTLLTPAARRLGEMWDEDLCSFAEVTASLGTLRLMLLRLRDLCGPTLPIRDAARSVLLASLVGNEHSFGLQVTAEIFRHAGWDVTIATAINEADLLGKVGNTWFAAVGLSIACDAQTVSLGRTIRSIRRASLNPRLGILAGGPACIRNPDLARLAGADATACDARQAVLRAEDLRRMMASAGQP